MVSGLGEEDNRKITKQEKRKLHEKLSFLYVCMVNTIYLLSFVETPRKFIIAELSIRKLDYLNSHVPFYT